MGSGAFARPPIAAVLGCLGLIAVMAATCPSGAAAETHAVAMSSEADYYTRRARSVLEAEKAALPQPHPLAASYPGQDVVVCEAGCLNGSGPHVVFLRPEAPEMEERREGVMVPTSASDGRQVPLDEVTCIAGCYGTEKTAAIEAAPALEEPLPAGLAGPAAVSIEEWTPPLRMRTTIDDKLSPVR